MCVQFSFLVKWAVLIELQLTELQDQCTHFTKIFSLSLSLSVSLWWYSAIKVVLVIYTHILRYQFFAFA